MTIIDLLKRHEGLSLAPYDCPAGFKTIGYGHNMEANPLTGYIDFYFIRHDSITQDMADYLLDRDITEAGKWAEMLTLNWSKLSQNRRNVIISMLFILGPRRYGTFKRFIAAVAAEDFSEASDQIIDSLMYRQLGGDPPGTDDGKLERPEELAAMMREG